MAIYAVGSGTQHGAPNSQAVVLLCAKVSGTPTSTARAELTVVTCPPDLPPGRTQAHRPHRPARVLTSTATPSGGPAVSSDHINGIRFYPDRGRSTAPPRDRCKTKIDQYCGLVTLNVFYKHSRLSSP